MHLVSEKELSALPVLLHVEKLLFVVAHQWRICSREQQAVEELEERQAVGNPGVDDKELEKSIRLGFGLGAFGWKGGKVVIAVGFLDCRS